MYIDFIKNNFHYSEQAIDGLFSEHLSNLSNSSFDDFSELALDFIDIANEHNKPLKKYFSVFFYIYVYKDLSLLAFCAKIHGIIFKDLTLRNYFDDIDLLNEIELFIMRKECVFSILSGEVVHEQSQSDTISFNDCLDDDDDDDIDLKDLIAS